VSIALAASSSVEKPVNGRILLLDDDPAIRQILLRLLENEEYFVRAAADGTEAVALAQVTQFDLALLDLNMPVADGWEIIKQLTALHPTLAIILITARPDRFYPALASGVDALLEKPLDFVVLFQTIRELMETPRKRAWNFLQPHLASPPRAVEERRAN
jgi:CheY-like chemotaxis protein